MAQKNLTFGYKVSLLPTLAALGFVMILVASVFLGQRSANLLSVIQFGYVPSFELSRDLQGDLADLRQTLQDAVVGRDAGLLGVADSVSTAFAGRVDVGRGNPLLEAATNRGWRRSPGSSSSALVYRTPVA